MILIKDLIVKDLQKIVKELTGQDVVPILEHPKDKRHGDYSANIALAIFASSKLKVQSSKFGTPIELANKIASSLQQLASNYLEKVEAVKPGFINFYLSKDYLVNLLTDVIKQEREYGTSSELKNKKIMLEFADPNPFKEFHIGHLRNITLGESYARLLESQGAEVWRVNYQGDVGMHVAKALYALLSSKFKVQSSKLEKESLIDKIKALGEAYALGSKAYEEDEQAKKDIQSINIKVYKNDPEIRKLWEKGRKWSLDYFETIYKRVGTSYKRYYFESEVAETGRKLVLDHIKDGIFEKSEGAVVFKAQGSGLHTRVFITKEDYATYEAKDMALAPIKYKDFVYDKSIIITAHEQAPYFRVVLAAMKLVSPDLAAKTEHDSFGFVFLKDAKMSSRLGNIVTGEWLLDEAKARIKKSFKEMDEETAEKVAVGAVKYSMLKVGRESNIAFDFDESISLEGNSGPYLQYTFARTQSVLSKSHVILRPAQRGEGSQSKRDSSVASPGARRYMASLPQNDKTIEEISLLRSVHRFPEVVGEAAESFAPNLLCNYLFDLSQKFNLFYQKHKILRPVILNEMKNPNQTDEILRSAQDDNIQDFRLALTQAVGQVIKNGLNLLGIKAPERM